MRKRSQILDDLEGLYREAFQRARDRDDQEAMDRLDFEFRREQLYLEILLDVRRIMAGVESGLVEVPEEAKGGGAEALLERAAQIRRLTRLR